MYILGLTVIDDPTLKRPFKGMDMMQQWRDSMQKQMNPESAAGAAGVGFFQKLFLRKEMRPR